MKKGYVVLLSITLAFILAFSGCTSTPSSTPAQTSSPSSSPTTNTAQAASSQSSDVSLAGLEAAIEKIYTQVNPSVVNLTVQVATSSALPSTHPSVPGTQFSEVQGSAFLWDSEGNFVTNNHVVDGGSNITVTFSDGTILPGKVVGTDADSDLAVVKADLPSNLASLTPLEMADSTQLKVGQMAIAIGNPFGLQGSLSVGFVSSLGRLIPANLNATGPGYSIPDIIQTDAAINPGNSGGVLLDGTGKVIGVTQSIDTQSGSSSGVGFAIPSAIVKQVVPSLIISGHYDHPYLGVTISSLTPDVATAMELPSNQRGALVNAVAAGGPAQKAGIQASTKTVTIKGQDVLVGGDVIIAYDGQAVKSSDDLITYLARSGYSGQTLTLTILRDGKQMDVQVTVGIRPAS